MRPRELTRSQVTVLFICDTLNSGFDLAFLYVPLVQKYGQQTTVQPER